MENKCCGLCQCWIKTDEVQYQDDDGKEHSMGLGECHAHGPRIPPLSLMQVGAEEGKEIPVEEWLWPETFENSFCVVDFKLKISPEQARVASMFMGGKEK